MTNNQAIYVYIHLYSDRFPNIALQISKITFSICSNQKSPEIYFMTHAYLFDADNYFSHDALL